MFDHKLDESLTATFVISTIFSQMAFNTNFYFLVYEPKFQVDLKSFSDRIIYI